MSGSGGDGTDGRRGPIRPLIVLPSDPFGDQIGGIKTFVRDFVRFAPDDFEVELIICSSDPAARPLGRWQPGWIDGRSVRFLPILATPDVHRRPLIPRSLRFAAAAVASRRARRTGGRILQFHHPGAPAPYLIDGAPKILVVHLNAADIGRGIGESRWGAVPGLLHRYEDITLPRMDRIFAVNEEGAAFYRERHPDVADRVAFLPTFVDSSAFAPLDDAGRVAARRDLLRTIGRAEDGDDRLVLFAGRLERQKDPMLLVETIAAARASDPRVRLVVIGEGGLRDDAERHARELGLGDAVHWLGFRPHEALPTVMNGADALLLTSVFEGMPITVLEALASGLPVVTTDVGGVSRIVHDGSNGRRVTERSASALATALAWVLDRPRHTFLASSREAVAPYAPATVLRPFYDAHREVAGAAHRH